jgi:hypothetical protein
MLDYFFALTLLKLDVPKVIIEPQTGHLGDRSVVNTDTGL